MVASERLASHPGETACPGSNSRPLWRTGLTVVSADRNVSGAEYVHLRTIVAPLRRAPGASARGALAPGSLRAAPALRRQRERQRRLDPRAGRARPGRLLGRAGANPALGRAVHDRAGRLEPAVLQVVRRRQPQRVLQLPGPARRGRPRRSRRVSLGRRGGRTARDHLRRPAPRRAEARECAQGAWRRQGRRRRDLSADDSRGRRRDARVREDRRASQRRVRRVRARGGQGAHGGLARQGADHRRRRAAQGQDRAHQGRRRHRDGRPRLARAHRRGAPHRHRRADERAPRRVLRRDPRRGGRRLPGRADGGRAPAVHPLLLGLDGEAEGDRPHDRRLFDRRQLDAPGRVRPRPRARRVLVLGRRRLGHRALLHRLRAALQRRDERDVRGRARLPAQGHLVGADRALRRDGLLHRPDGDPRVHEVGCRAAQRARPVEPAAAGHGRRADQPQGVAVVPPRHRPRALPDRRHLVADRDRADHDLAPPRADGDQAGLGDPPHAGHRRRRGRRGDGRERRAGPGAARDHAPVARDAAHAVRRRRALRRDLLVALRPTRPTWSGTPRSATRMDTCGSSGGSTT